MKKIRFVASLLILAVSEISVAAPSSDQQPPPPSLESRLQELQKMSDSMQKINALYNNCKMGSECILAGLHEMATKEHDAVAQSMLDEFEKQHKITMQAFAACFDQERQEVTTALQHCSEIKDIHQKNNCIETALLSLIQQGNSFAQITLLEFYKEQNETQKAAELDKKLKASKDTGLNAQHLKNCLEEITKKGEVSRPSLP